MPYRASAILIVAFMAWALAAPAFSDSIGFDLTPPSFDAAGAGGSRRAVDGLSMPGFSIRTSSGNPALPCKLLYIALPPDADPATVHVAAQPVTVEIPGRHEVQPVPPMATGDGEWEWGSGKQIAQGRNRLVYSADSFYPREQLRVREVGQARNVKIAVVEYWPYAYNPVSGKLRLATARSARLEFGRARTFSGLTADAGVVERPAFLDNPEEAAAWYGTGAREFDAVQQSSAAADYVIITTSSIAGASQAMGDFCNLLRLRGFNVRIATEQDWGGGTANQAAENIRRWLKANYLSLGIRYVLLVGNPDPYNGDVPMKMLWPRRNESCYREAPSDYYYSDLTGNWDLDGDGYSGEMPDDFGTGGVDRIPEVYVGRIPVYGSVADLDRILERIVDYQSGKLTEWSRRIVLPMKPLDSYTPCYQLGENIKRDVVTPLGMQAVRLYDDVYGLSSPAERRPCNPGPVQEEWSAGAGLVLWMTHGSSTSASFVVDSSNCGYVDGLKPSIVFAGSCSNGAPYASNNLAYTLLKQGAISTVAASYVSWYYIGEYDFTNSDSIGGIGYQYAKFLFSGAQSFAEALSNAKLTVPMYVWPNHLVFNLYGDPSVAFDKPAPGAISGRVMDVQGRLVPGALIRTLDGRYTATSQNDGTFLLRSLSSGTVSFSVAADGYQTQRYYEVPVTLGRLTNVNVALDFATPGSLSGHVCDEFGYPIEGAVVDVVELGRSVQSSSTGTYRFVTLPPGSYTIRATKSPYAQFVAHECEVAEGAATERDLTLSLSDGNAIQNGGFEKGFVQGLGVLWRSYASTGYAGVPAIGSDFARLGSASQKITLPASTAQSYAGIYQVGNVVPGCSYSIVAWQRDRFGGAEAKSWDNVICRVGYDLTGGTNPTAATVIWNQYTTPHDVWHSFFCQVKPYSPMVTIFLEGRRVATGNGDDCCAWFDDVSLNGPVQAPPVPLVVVDSRDQSDKESISASWSCASSDLASYEVAVSTTTDETGIVPGGAWMGVETNTSAVRTGLRLSNGDVVRVLVRARNASGAVSRIGCSEPVRIVEDTASPGQARDWPDGTWVRLRSVLVSRMGEGAGCFVETADRGSGIGVAGLKKNIPSMQPGTVVTVVGRLVTSGTVRMVADAEVMQTVTQKPIRPLSMSNVSVGGGSGSYVAQPTRGQRGSAWGSGVNTVGLLVTVVGRVTGVGSRQFVINDGSLPGGLTIRCHNNAGVPRFGQIARVTGIATPDGVDAYAARDVTSLL